MPAISKEQLIEALSSRYNKLSTAYYKFIESGDSEKSIRLASMIALLDEIFLVLKNNDQAALERLLDE